MKKSKIFDESSSSIFLAYESSNFSNYFDATGLKIVSLERGVFLSQTDAFGFRKFYL